MTLAAVLLLLVACAAAGGRLRGRLAREGQEPGYRFTLYAAAGVVGLYLGLLALDGLGIPWKPLALPLLLVALAAALQLLSRGRPTPARPLACRLGWGDGVALVALAALAFCAVRMWIVNADFIYHWGIKGHKFFLAQGIDFDYLARPWNWFIHPAYPHLLPTLFAATSLAAGERVEAAQMLWSPLFAAGVLLAARQVLRQSGVTPFTAQSTLAALGLALAMFGIGYQMAGSPDWLLALAPLLAWPALMGPALIGPALMGPAPAGRSAPIGPGDRAGDLAVGLAAALAAGAKVEGVVMAAVLAGVHLLGRGRGWLRAAPWTLLPPALVILPWLVQGLRYDLFSELGGGAFSFRHLEVILQAAGQSLLARAWHGATAVVLLLPLLFLPRATRPVAAVCSLQLAFYLWVYLGLPYEESEAVTFYVRSNFSRLAFHLVPTLLVATGIALDRWAAGGSPRRSPAGDAGEVSIED